MLRGALAEKLDLGIRPALNELPVWVRGSASPEKHFSWYMRRMRLPSLYMIASPSSIALWHSLHKCPNLEAFMTPMVQYSIITPETHQSSEAEWSFH